MFFFSSWKQVLRWQCLHFQVYIMVTTSKIQLSRVLSKIIIKNYYLSHWKSCMIFCKRAKGPFLLERPKPAVPLTISYDQFRLLIGSYSVVEIWYFAYSSTVNFLSWIPVSPTPKSLTISAKNLHWCLIFCCGNLLLYQKKKWKWQKQIFWWKTTKNCLKRLKGWKKLIDSVILDSHARVKSLNENIKYFWRHKRMCRVSDILTIFKNRHFLKNGTLYLSMLIW